MTNVTLWLHEPKTFLQHSLYGMDLLHHNQCSVLFHAVNVYFVTKHFCPQLQ